jgi:putative transposase
MKFQPRKTIQLPQDQYIGRRIYFVTICCENRRAVFANPSNAKALLQDLTSVSQKMNFLLHAYCVMPDHLHILVEGQSTDCDLRLHVTKLKQKTGYSLRGAAEGDLWQKRYYDHILRKAEDSDSIAWYIWMNPVRQGLVSKPEQYPFSGSCTVNWPPTGAKPHEWTPPWKSLPRQT